MMTDDLLRECRAVIAGSGLMTANYRDDLLARIDAHLARQPQIIETRNAQGEVDGGYFAQGQPIAWTDERELSNMDEVGRCLMWKTRPTAAPPAVALYAAPVAAAQPPDAKPVAWLTIYSAPFLEEEKLYNYEPFNGKPPDGARVIPLYAAPQPPAGKGQEPHYTVLLGKLAEREQMWHDIGAICASGWTRDNEARSPNEWAEALLHDRDELREKLADAIPREIHDRLIRDAKRHAVHDVADAYERMGNPLIAEQLRSLVARSDWEWSRMSEEGDK